MKGQKETLRLMVMFIISAAIKSKKKVLINQSAAQVFLIFSEAVSHAWSSIIQDVVALVRNILVYFKKNTKNINILLIVLGLVIFSVRRQHMEITPQNYIAFCGRNMHIFSDFLPLAVADAVFTLKTHLCRYGLVRLPAVAVVEPHQQ